MYARFVVDLSHMITASWKYRDNCVKFPNELSYFHYEKIEITFATIFFIFSFFEKVDRWWINQTPYFYIVHSKFFVQPKRLEFQLIGWWAEMSPIKNDWINSEQILCAPRILKHFTSNWNAQLSRGVCLKREIHR
jgi:hypothetical protein